MPYDELSQFLAPVNGPTRNQVYVDALRKMMGLGPEDPRGFASETDTEDAAHELGLHSTDAEKYGAEMSREAIDTAKQVHDWETAADPRATEFRHRQMAEKVDEALGISKAQAYGAATGKNEAAITPEGELAANEALRRTIEEKQAPIAAKFGDFGGGSGGNVNPMIDNLAKAFAANPQYPVPADMKDAVVARAATMGPLSTALTNQSRRTQEIARSFLPYMEKTLRAGEVLNKRGWVGPVASRVRELASTTGMTGLMDIGGGDTGQLSAAFQSALDLLKTGIMQAHVGVRGASSPQLTERWNAVLNPHGDWATFTGQMAVLHELLRQYASGERVSATMKGDEGSTALEDALREITGESLDMFTNPQGQ